jgi:hypothetical protein
MSCNDVCIQVDADCISEFYNESTPRAAKPYLCCECRAAIGKGERYECVSGKWDGEVSTFRTCLSCAEIRKAFCCHEWTITTLWDDMDEQVFPEWNRDALSILDCLAKLTTDAATEKVRSMYAKYRGLSGVAPK